MRCLNGSFLILRLTDETPLGVFTGIEFKVFCIGMNNRRERERECVSLLYFIYLKVSLKTTMKHQKQENHKNIKNKTVKESTVYSVFTGAHLEHPKGKNLKQ